MQRIKFWRGNRQNDYIYQKYKKGKKQIMRKYGELNYQSPCTKADFDLDLLVIKLHQLDKES